MNFSRSPHTPDARARDAQSKFMEEAVQKVEKHFGKICSDMGGVTRKTGRLRDKYDKLAKTCRDYADVEQGSLTKHLNVFAEQVSNIQDYRQAEKLPLHELNPPHVKQLIEIERLQAKVIDPLSEYESMCKHTKVDLNKSFKARKQEIKQHDRVANLQNRSTNNPQSLAQAEADLQRRTIEVARTTRDLEEKVDEFEVKKIHDLKRILSEFVKIEMMFHAKALEVYSQAYNELAEIDEDEHLEVFRNSLRPSTNMQERLDLATNAANMSLRDPPQASGTLKSGDRNNRSGRRDEEEEEDYDWESEEESDVEDEIEELSDVDSPRTRSRHR